MYNTLKKMCLIVSFVLFIICISPNVFAATYGASCDYGDGGEMVKTNTTSWSKVLSYYDINHHVIWLIERYITYTCNVNSSHTLVMCETKRVAQEDLGQYGL